MLSGLVIGFWIGDVRTAAASAVGALLPDLDSPHSFLGRRAGLAGNMLRLFVEHRGIMHSGIAAAIVTLTALTAPDAERHILLAVAAGYVSHITLDALTMSGVPLLWPSRRRFRLLALRSGGMVDQMLAIALILCLVVRRVVA